MHVHRATARLSCKDSTDACGVLHRECGLYTCHRHSAVRRRSTAAFLSEDVAIRLSPAADRCFHDLCQPPGHCAEKPVPLPGRYRRLRTYCRAAGPWRLVLCHRKVASEDCKGKVKAARRNVARIFYSIQIMRSKPGLAGSIYDRVAFVH
jgi:hypothetical protein